jgi:hypothetical protein
VVWSCYRAEMTFALRSWRRRLQDMLRGPGNGLSSAVGSGDPKFGSGKSVQIFSVDAEIMEKTSKVLSHALNIGQIKYVF